MLPTGIDRCALRASRVDCNRLLLLHDAARITFNDWLYSKRILLPAAMESKLCASSRNLDLYSLEGAGTMRHKLSGDNSCKVLVPI